MDWLFWGGGGRETEAGANLGSKKIFKVREHTFHTWELRARGRKSGALFIFCLLELISRVEVVTTDITKVTSEVLSKIVTYGITSIV